MWLSKDFLNRAAIDQLDIAKQLIMIKAGFSDKKYTVINLTRLFIIII